MSNFKSKKAEDIKRLTDQIREKNLADKGGKAGCGCNFPALALLAGLFICAFLVIFFGFSAIETNFLEETAAYEAKFNETAQKFTSVANLNQSKNDSDILNNPKKYKPLICYSEPDRNNRLIARIHYKMPESRQPQSPNEANPIIRLDVKSDRTYTSQGSYKEEFPIYDIFIHYIDSKTNETILTQTVKGDPQDYNDNNRIDPGSVPIIQAEKKIAETMRYEPGFAWHGSY